MSNSGTAQTCHSGLGNAHSLAFCTCPRDLRENLVTGSDGSTSLPQAVHRCLHLSRGHAPVPCDGPSPWTRAHPMRWSFPVARDRRPQPSPPGSLSPQHLSHHLLPGEQETRRERTNGPTEMEPRGSADTWGSSTSVCWISHTRVFMMQGNSVLFAYI